MISDISCSAHMHAQFPMTVWLQLNKILVYPLLIQIVMPVHFVFNAYITFILVAFWLQKLLHKLSQKLCAKVYTWRGVLIFRYHVKSSKWGSLSIKMWHCRHTTSLYTTCIWAMSLLLQIYTPFLLHLADCTDNIICNVVSCASETAMLYLFFPRIFFVENISQKRLGLHW